MLWTSEVLLLGLPSEVPSLSQEQVQASKGSFAQISATMHSAILGNDSHSGCPHLPSGMHREPVAPFWVSTWLWAVIWPILNEWWKRQMKQKVSLNSLEKKTNGAKDGSWFYIYPSLHEDLPRYSPGSLSGLVEQNRKTSPLGWSAHIFPVCTSLCDWPTCSGLTEKACISSVASIASFLQGHPSWAGSCLPHMAFWNHLNPGSRLCVQPAESQTQQLMERRPWF